MEYGVVGLRKICETAISIGEGGRFMEVRLRLSLSIRNWLQVGAIVVVRRDLNRYTSMGCLNVNNRVEVELM